MLPIGQIGDASESVLKLRFHVDHFLVCQYWAVTTTVLDANATKLNGMIPRFIEFS